MKYLLALLALVVPAVAVDTKLDRIVPVDGKTVVTLSKPLVFQSASVPTISGTDVAIFNDAGTLKFRTSTTTTTIGSGGGGMATTDIDTSAELRAILTDESGTGALIFAGGALGAATATSINGLTISSSTGTVTIANGKTFTASNTLTLAGTDGSTLNIGTGGTLGSAAYTATSAYDAAGAAAVAQAASQPLDSDLTSIAALTTTSFGRGLLAETNAASLKTTLSLNSVENTALSTWAGTSNITTLGTITTGTWTGGTIAVANGGTGQTTKQAAIDSLLAASGALSQGDLFYFNGTNIVRLGAGTSGHFLKTLGPGANPTWASASGSGTVTNTGGNLTSNAVVLGAGGSDTKVVSALTTNGAGILNLGAEGAALGGAIFYNMTSGNVYLAVPSGALSNPTVTLPNVTGTLVTTGDTGTVTNTMLAGSISLSSKVTGTLPYANGGTNATTQADAVTNMQGAKIFASGAALSAATPTMAGQMGIATDGAVAWGLGTSAGGYVAGNISLLNPTIYVSTLSLSTALAQTAGTSQLRSLNVSDGNLTVSNGQFVTYGTNTAFITVKAGSFVDNVLAIRNDSTDGYSAISFYRSADGNPGIAAIGVNDASGAGDYANAFFIASNPEDSTPNTTPPPIVLTQHRADGAPANQHRRIYITEDNVRLYGWSTSAIAGPIGVDVAASGNVTLAPTSAGTVTIGGGATASSLNFLEPSGSGTNKITVTAPALAADRALTWPDADGEIVTNSATQTLTNKTLTSPTIAKIGNLTSNGLVKTTSSDGTLAIATSGTDYVHPSRANTMCSGRLTLTSATPVLTSSVTGAGTVYFTPYKGNSIALYDGSAWKAMTFSELSITLSSLAINTAYDIWAYDNSGNVALDTTAWTNSTTRATAIAYQDGVAVKSGAATRRYLGSMILDGSKQVSVTFGSAAAGGGAGQFDLWNYNNRVACSTMVQDTTDSWNYTTNTWRSSNNSATNRVTLFLGLSEDVVTADATGTAANSSAVGRWTGIGLDSTSAYTGITGRSAPTTIQSQTAFYRGFPGIGQHYLQWLEKSNATGTCTWYGDNAADGTQSGMTVTLFY